MDETQNPWQIIGKKNVYDNKWIGVTEYDVINPSGGKGIYGTVHFKNLAIGVLPLDEDRNTYLVGQFRFTINQFTWELPEGGGDLNESPLSSAQRELLEETGLKASGWKQVLEMHLSNSVTDEYCIVFVATGLTRHTATPEETEQIVVKKLPFEEVYQMVMEGKITDAISVAAILKVKMMIMEGRM